MIAPINDPRVDELLLLPRKSCARAGQCLCALELCSTCPELAGELERRIELLCKFDPLLDDTGITGPRHTQTVPGPAGMAIRDTAAARADYRDLRFHAAGALGEVFLARNAELNRDVAAQVSQARARALRPRACQPDFSREARITGRLEHPGVVPIYALGYDSSGAPCYAMRFIRGATLQDAIDAFHAAEKSGRDPSERLAGGFREAFLTGSRRSAQHGGLRTLTAESFIAI